MSVTVQGMIGRAIMAATPEERTAAESVATLLMVASKRLTDWRSIVVIESGKRIQGFPAREWDAAMSDAAMSDADGRAMLAEWAAAGGKVIDGRGFTAAGRPRVGRDAYGMVSA